MKKLDLRVNISGCASYGAFSRLFPFLIIIFLEWLKIFFNAFQVVNIHDCPTILHVPMALKEQGLVGLLSSRLSFDQPLKPRGSATLKWRHLAESAEHLRKSVIIALVGKYTSLDDAYLSVYNALYHASLACGRKLSLIKIESEDLEEVIRNLDE